MRNYWEGRDITSKSKMFTNQFLKKKKLVLSRTQFSDTDSMKGNHVQAQLLYSRKKKKIKKICRLVRKLTQQFLAT